MYHRGGPSAEKWPLKIVPPFAFNRVGCLAIKHTLRNNSPLPIGFSRQYVNQRGHSTSYDHGFLNHDADMAQIWVDNLRAGSERETDRGSR